MKRKQNMVCCRSQNNPASVFYDAMDILNLRCTPILPMEEGIQDIQLILIDVKDDHKDYPKLPVILLNNEKIYGAEDGENYQTCKDKLRKAILGKEE